MPRFINGNDLNLFKTIAEEFTDYIAEQSIVLFKMSVGETKTNLYGEGIGKVYHEPAVLMARVKRESTSPNYDGFGNDKVGNITLEFNRERLRTHELPRVRDINGTFVTASSIQNTQYGYPEIGDIVLFDDSYFEIDNVMSSDLIAGQPSIYDTGSAEFANTKTFLTATGFMVRRSQIQIENRVN